MRISLAAVVGVAMLVCVGEAQDFKSRAIALHRQTPLIDGHNDLPVGAAGGSIRAATSARRTSAEPVGRGLMTDIPRLREGGHRRRSSGRSTCPSTMHGPGQRSAATLEQIDIVHRMTMKWPETFEIAYTAEDIERSFKAKRIGSLIGMEGGHSIDNSLATLRMLYAARRAVHDAHAHRDNLAWADCRQPTSPVTTWLDRRRSAKKSCAR